MCSGYAARGGEDEIAFGADLAPNLAGLRATLG
jgi:hypothetical protein